MAKIISGKDIIKTYQNGSVKQEVLKGVSVDFEEGSFSCIMGASGSGKSTLLYILSTLEGLDKGEVYFRSRKVPSHTPKNDKALSQLRSQHFSFIFQFYNLMPALTVEENIYLPLLLAKRNINPYKGKVDEFLELVELSDSRKKKVSQLSGGEQQRVSIVRALSTDTEVIFADEPTGNLDYNNSIIIIDLLKKLSKKYNKTVIMVSHDQDILRSVDKVYSLKNGILAEE